MSDEQRLAEYRAIADAANDHALQLEAKLLIAIRCLKKLAIYSPSVPSVILEPMKALREIRRLTTETLEHLGN